MLFSTAVSPLFMNFQSLQDKFTSADEFAVRIEETFEVGSDDPPPPHPDRDASKAEITVVILIFNILDPFILNSITLVLPLVK